MGIYGSSPHGETGLYQVLTGSQAYYNFYRMNMYAMLMEFATGPGKAEPRALRLHHACASVDYDTGRVTFLNGVTATHDLIVGADSIGVSSSAPRTSASINQYALTVRRPPHPRIFLGKKRETSTSYHRIIPTSEIHRLNFSTPPRNGLEYWGGQGLDKIIAAACRNGDIHSFYTFFPLTNSSSAGEGWNFAGTREQLQAPFSKLDPTLRALFDHAVDIKPWNLCVHSLYPYWTKGRTCIMGDAARSMLPDQSQGACQAIEDAAALEIIFGPLYSYTTDVGAGLRLYEQIWKPRTSKVQAASARARVDLSERIDFSSQKGSKLYEVADKNKKLTIEVVNEHVSLFIINLRYKLTKAQV